MLALVNPVFPVLVIVAPGIVMFPLLPVVGMISDVVESLIVKVDDATSEPKSYQPDSHGQHPKGSS